MDVSDARKLKALENKSSRFNKLLAEVMLDKAILTDVAAKMVKPTRSGMPWRLPVRCTE